MPEPTPDRSPDPVPDPAPVPARAGSPDQPSGARPILDYASPELRKVSLGRVAYLVMCALLAVVAGAGLLLALATALNSSRERHTPRLPAAICSSNLKPIGTGLIMYHNDYHSCPRLARYSDPPTPDEIAQTLFLLVKYADLSTAIFNCPVTDASPDMAPWTASNFARPDRRSLSDALTNPAPAGRPVGFRWGASQSANWAVMADGNYPAPGKNSHNHNGEGQNVLFNDGHVDWFTTVKCGRLSTGAVDDITTPAPDPMDTHLLPLAWP
jgi:hypothetical protein